MLCRTLFLGVAVPLREHEQQLDVALLHEAWSSSSTAAAAAAVAAAAAIRILVGHKEFR